VAIGQRCPARRGWSAPRSRRTTVEADCTLRVPFERLPCHRPTTPPCSLRCSRRSGPLQNSRLPGTADGPVLLVRRPASFGLSRDPRAGHPRIGPNRSAFSGMGSCPEPETTVVCCSSSPGRAATSPLLADFSRGHPFVPLRPSPAPLSYPAATPFGSVVVPSRPAGPRPPLRPVPPSGSTGRPAPGITAHARAA